MNVKDVMTTEVITVSPETSLNEVGKILKGRRVSGVPVVGDEGKLVGIITLTDMLRILDRIYKWREIEKTQEGVRLSDMFEEEKTEAKVKNFMTKEVLTLEEEDSIDEVMKLMFIKGVHTIPVVKDNKMVGVVGKRDLVEACF